jgi:hypothetical protein
MTAAKIIPAMQIVSTGNLNTAMRRNLSRFPADFMFQLTAEEVDSLRFQFGILQKGLRFNKPQGRARHSPRYVVSGSARAAIHI